jgi:hypothetical protein
MDQDEIRRIAEGYRQMRDEQLAALLAEQSTLTDEARQALLDVVAERPDPAGIHRQAMDEIGRQAERQSQKGAEGKAREEAKVQRSSDRPDTGVWLWLLTGTLGALALWRVYDYVMLRVTEVQLPQVLEMAEWPTAKAISLGASVSALIAAGIGIHAIHAGTTWGHLRRAIAALWYVLPGVLVIELAAAGVLLFGFENFLRSLGHLSTVAQLVTTVFVASLWTAYLIRSQRCRRRYPRPGGSILRVFE